MYEIESSESPEELDIFPLPLFEDTEEIEDLKLRRLSSFNNGKKIAIYRVGAEFGQYINILRNTYMLEQKKIPGLPSKLFSWDMHQLINRLQTNTIWMSLLQRNYTCEQLEIKKFVTDLNELEYYFLLILHNYLQSGSNINFKIIMKCSFNLQELEDELIKVFEKNKNIAERTASILLEMELQSLHLQRVYTTCGDVEIIEPIISRYQMAHIQSVEYQFKLKYDLIFEKLQKEIEDYVSKIKSDDYISNQVRVLYSTHITPLRERIRVMQLRYDADYDDVLHQNAKLLTKIKNLTIKRKYLEELVDNFRSQIDTWLESEKQRLERISYEEEDLVREMLNARRTTELFEQRRRSSKIPRLSNLRRSSFKVGKLKIAATKLAKNSNQA